MAVIESCSAFLDLYVAPDDVRQLLGVSSQVWYVQNGTVHKYALGYIMVVPPQVNTLTFHWRAVKPRTMPYTLRVDVGNREAIEQPVLSIKDKSIVPQHLEAWTITLKCTGRLTTQVDVKITIKVAFTSVSNVTTLTILRKKICHRDNSIEGGIAVEVVETRHSTTVMYVTIGCLTVFLIIVAVLAIVNHIRNNKNTPSDNRNNRQSGRSSNGTRNNATAVLPNNQRGLGSASVPVGKNSQSSLSELRRSPQPTNTTTATTTTTTGSPEPQFTDPRLGDVSAKLAGLRVSEDSLQLLELDMEGTFGRVYHCLYHSHVHNQPQYVKVKTVGEDSSELQRSVMVAEALMLANLNHKHLLSVLGAITHQDAPPKVIFPITSQGNLKRFLQGCHTLVTREVVAVGVQVLTALQYMHSQLLLHKDVATRNCVIDDGLHVRLGDCALSRDLFPGDYHCLGDNENRPIKWLGLESLSNKVFTPASDVWSWGVLLWEVMTLGQQPYVEIDPFEMAAVLRQGVRLAQPINCPDELFKAMTFCWTTASRERPTVDELIMYLTNFQQHLDRYV